MTELRTFSKGNSEPLPCFDLKYNLDTIYMVCRNIKTLNKVLHIILYKVERFIYHFAFAQKSNYLNLEGHRAKAPTIFICKEHFGIYFAITGS